MCAGPSDSSTQEENACQAHSIIIYKISSNVIRSVKIISMDLATNNTARSMPGAFMLLTSFELICDPITLFARWAFVLCGRGFIHGLYFRDVENIPSNP